jgi:hypothetical protein
VPKITAGIDLKGLAKKEILLTTVMIDGVNLDHIRDKNGILYRNSEPDAAPTTNIGKIVQNVQLAGETYQVVDIDSSNHESEDAVDIVTSIKQALTILASFNSSSIRKDAKESAIYNDVYDQAKVYGYANVKNTQMEDTTPDLTIQNITIRNYKSDDDTYKIKVENLSSNPNILSKPTTFDVRTINNDSVKVYIFISNNIDIKNYVEFRVSGLPDDVLSGVRIMGYGIKADNMSVTGKGNWSFQGVDDIKFKVPFEIALSGVSIHLGAINPGFFDINISAIVSGDLNDTYVGVNLDMITKSISYNALENRLKELGIIISNGLVFAGNNLQHSNKYVW